MDPRVPTSLVNIAQPYKIHELTCFPHSAYGSTATLQALQQKLGPYKVATTFEAIRDDVNGWYVGVVALRQAGHSRLAALGAPQSFVPIICHGSQQI